MSCFLAYFRDSTYTTTRVEIAFFRVFPDFFMFLSILVKTLFSVVYVYRGNPQKPSQPGFETRRQTMLGCLHVIGSKFTVLSIVECTECVPYENAKNR